MMEWERILLDPEYALESAKREYESAVSVLDDLVRSHINAGHSHTYSFLRDLRAQTEMIADIQLLVLENEAVVNARKNGWASNHG